MDWTWIVHFQRDEFLCPCCGKEHMDARFMQRLDTARTLAGVPFKVNSGWRCSAYNEQVSSNSTGRHVKGQAADIDADDAATRGAILRALYAAGFMSFALADGFIHVDSAGVPWVGLYD